MFDDEHKIFQVLSEVLKLMFGFQKEYILFMCMFVIQMSMPKPLTVTIHLHLFLSLSSATFEVYVGCIAMKSVICLPYVLLPLPSHIPPICFLLFFK